MGWHQMDFKSKSTGRWTIPSKWLPKRVQEAACTDSDGNYSEMLSAIFDALSAHVVLLDRLGRVEHASRSWLEFGRINGAAESSVGVGANYLEVCRSATQEGDPLARRALDEIQAVLERRLPSASMEYPCHDPGLDGKKRWYLLNVDPMPPEHGGVVITHTDITERKQVENALKENTERLRLALEAGQMGVWDLALTTNTLEWSSEQFAIMGRDPFGVRPTFQTWADQVHPDDLPSVLASLTHAIESKNEYRSEYRIIWQDGSIHWVLARGTPIVDAEGRCLRCMGLIVDITARKQAEDNLLKTLEDVRRLKERIEAENDYLREEVSDTHRFGQIVSQSGPMIQVLKQAEQVAPTDTTVLIVGETGTGKELLARSIHALSKRKDRPLVKVDCASLPGSLIESELFGHERGSFTGALSRRVGRFELADQATIFLDEIGELPLDLQAKLLRVLQEHEFERVGSSKTFKVDVRIIAATNRDLSLAVREGRFREDLYYRLNVYPIRMPSLRERKEDIGPIAESYLADCDKRLGRPARAISQSIFSSLHDYHWPGNVRELRNVIERTAVTSPGRKLRLPVEWETINPRPLPPYPLNSTAQHGLLNSRSALDGNKLDHLERSYILNVLERCQWRIQGVHGAAAILGLNPSTLRSRMNKLGIRRT